MHFYPVCVCWWLSVLSRLRIHTSIPPPLAACPVSSALFRPSFSRVSPCHADSPLSPSHTGKAPDTPLAQPPTSEKDAQNRTEQRGELLPHSLCILACGWGLSETQAPQKASCPEEAELTKGWGEGRTSDIRPGIPAGFKNPTLTNPAVTPARPHLAAEFLRFLP